MTFQYYNSSYQRPLNGKRGSNALYIIITITLIFFSGIGILFFHSNSNQKTETKEMEQDLPADERVSASLPTLIPDQTQSTAMSAVSSFPASGTAYRRLTADATIYEFRGQLPTLPIKEGEAISRYFYESWIIRPFPFDVRSVGAVAYISEENEWQWVWKSAPNEDMSAYTKYIITREVDDGDPSPNSEHVLEGEF